MKRRRKNSIFPMAVLVAIIIISAILLLLSQKTFFPEKLGDMELKLHREGDVAVREVQNSHSAKDNVTPDQAHIARYRSGTGNRATVSVTEAETEKRAAEKIYNMNPWYGRNVQHSGSLNNKWLENLLH